MKVSFKTVYPDGSHSSHTGEISKVIPSIELGPMSYRFKVNIHIERGDGESFSTWNDTVIITPRRVLPFLRIFFYALEGKLRCFLAQVLHMPMILHRMFTSRDFLFRIEEAFPRNFRRLSGEFRANLAAYVEALHEDFSVRVWPYDPRSEHPLPRLHRFE
jgi:hypothetical protein